MSKFQLQRRSRMIGTAPLLRISFMVVLFYASFVIHLIEAVPTYKFIVQPHDITVLKGKDLLIPCRVARRTILPNNNHHSYNNDRRNAHVNSFDDGIAIAAINEYSSSPRSSTVNRIMRLRRHQNSLQQGQLISSNSMMSSSKSKEEGTSKLSDNDYDMFDYRDKAHSAMFENESDIPKVQWIKDGFGLGTYIEMLEYSSRMSIRGNMHKGEFHLSIISVSEEDAGTYQCQINPSENFPGLLSNEANLTVLIPPGNPIILNGPLIEVNEATRVNITCMARNGFPPNTLNLWVAATGTRGLNGVAIPTTTVESVINIKTHRNESRQDSITIPWANRDRNDIMIRRAVTEPEHLATYEGSIVHEKNRKKRVTEGYFNFNGNSVAKYEPLSATSWYREIDGSNLLWIYKSIMIRTDKLLNGVSVVCESKPDRYELNFDGVTNPKFPSGVETTLRAKSLLNIRYAPIVKLQESMTSQKVYGRLLQLQGNLIPDRTANEKRNLQFEVVPSLHGSQVSAQPILTIQEGHKLRLTCTIDANPIPEHIDWYVNDKRRHEKFRYFNHRPSLSYYDSDVEDTEDNLKTDQNTLDRYFIDDGSSVLIAQSLTRANHGDRIRCTSKNMLGESSSSVTLNVEYSPSFVLRPKSTLAIDLGKRANLTCIADGNPQPYYIWYRFSDNNLSPNTGHDFTAKIKRLFMAEDVISQVSTTVKEIAFKGRERGDTELSSTMHHHNGTLGIASKDTPETMSFVKTTTTHSKDDKGQHTFKISKGPYLIFDKVTVSDLGFYSCYVYQPSLPEQFTRTLTLHDDPERMRHLSHPGEFSRHRNRESKQPSRHRKKHNSKVKRSSHTLSAAYSEPVLKTYSEILSNGPPKLYKFDIKSIGFSENERSILVKIVAVVRSAPLPFKREWFYNGTRLTVPGNSTSYRYEIKNSDDTEDYWTVSTLLLNLPVSELLFPLSINPDPSYLYERRDFKNSLNTPINSYEKTDGSPLDKKKVHINFTVTNYYGSLSSYVTVDRDSIPLTMHMQLQAKGQEAPVALNIMKKVYLPWVLLSLGLILALCALLTCFIYLGTRKKKVRDHDTKKCHRGPADRYTSGFHGHGDTADNLNSDGKVIAGTVGAPGLSLTDECLGGRKNEYGNSKSTDDSSRDSLPESGVIKVKGSNTEEPGLSSSNNLKELTTIPNNNGSDREEGHSCHNNYLLGDNNYETLKNGGYLSSSGEGGFKDCGDGMYYDGSSPKSGPCPESPFLRNTTSGDPSSVITDQTKNSCEVDDDPNSTTPLRLPIRASKNIPVGKAPNLSAKEYNFIENISSDSALSCDGSEEISSDKSINNNNNVQTLPVSCCVLMIDPKSMYNNQRQDVRLLAYTADNARTGMVYDTKDHCCSLSRSLQQKISGYPELSSVNKDINSIKNIDRYGDEERQPMLQQQQQSNTENQSHLYSYVVMKPPSSTMTTISLSTATLGNYDRVLPVGNNLANETISNPMTMRLVLTDMERASHISSCHHELLLPTTDLRTTETTPITNNASHILQQSILTKNRNNQIPPPTIDTTNYVMLGHRPQTTGNDPPFNPLVKTNNNCNNEQHGPPPPAYFYYKYNTLENCKTNHVTRNKNYVGKEGQEDYISPSNNNNNDNKASSKDYTFLLSSSTGSGISQRVVPPNSETGRKRYSRPYNTWYKGIEGVGTGAVGPPYCGQTKCLDLQSVSTNNPSITNDIFVSKGELGHDDIIINKVNYVLDPSTGGISHLLYPNYESAGYNNNNIPNSIKTSQNQIKHIYPPTNKGIDDSYMSQRGNIILNELEQSNVVLPLKNHFKRVQTDDGCETIFTPTRRIIPEIPPKRNSENYVNGILRNYDIDGCGHGQQHLMIKDPETLSNNNLRGRCPPIGLIAKENKYDDRFLLPYPEGGGGSGYQAILAPNDEIYGLLHCRSSNHQLKKTFETEVFLPSAPNGLHGDRKQCDNKKLQGGIKEVIHCSGPGTLDLNYQQPPLNICNSYSLPPPPRLLTYDHFSPETTSPSSSSHSTKGSSQAMMVSVVPTPTADDYYHHSGKGIAIDDRTMYHQYASAQEKANVATVDKKPTCKNTDSYVSKLV